MRYRTELMEAILQSRHAQQMIDFIAPVYGESFTALWLLEVIGRVLDNATGYGESLEQQTVPQTVSWAIDYWEQEFGIFPDPFETLEERRNNILTKLGAAPPANPYMLAALAESIAGVPCKIIENVSKNTFILEMYGLSPSRIRAENAVWRAKPAHLFMRAACRFPNIIFTEVPGNLLLRTLHIGFRIPFYGDFVELNGRKRLDGGWILHQARPGFDFPYFQCRMYVKENYGTMPAGLRYRVRVHHDYGMLQTTLLLLKYFAFLQNSCGGIQNHAQLQLGFKNQNHYTVKLPEVRFHTRVANCCGSMHGTLQKGSIRKMNGKYKFDGSITFSKTQSSKEEI